MTGRRFTAPDTPLADSRIAFPRADAPTRCQADPQVFAIEDVVGRAERRRALDKAKRACGACPIVTGCLKWALANPELTTAGVWAATTARDRTALRADLVRRLGPDWAGVVAAKDRRPPKKPRAPRTAPPTARDQAIARLELELIPSRPAPYEPWKEPLTPARQAHNRAVLAAALRTRAA